MAPPTIPLAIPRTILAYPAALPAAEAGTGAMTRNKEIKSVNSFFIKFILRQFKKKPAVLFEETAGLVVNNEFFD
jgi:hypothetical protein